MASEVDKCTVCWDCEMRKGSKRTYRNSKSVADAVLEKEYVQFILHPRSNSLWSYRKDRPIGQTFGKGFQLSEMIDAAADVYNGVSSIIAQRIRSS